MEEMYQRGASLPALPQEKDPFWDPVEPLHLGSAHLWLHSLAFRIAVDEQVEVVGPEGTEEAMLHACLVPCSPKGLWVTFSSITVMHHDRVYTVISIILNIIRCVCRPLGEDDILIDPTELLGKRLDFQLILAQCCGLRWVKEARTRGIQIGYVSLSVLQLCVSVCCSVC